MSAFLQKFQEQLNHKGKADWWWLGVMEKGFRDSLRGQKYSRICEDDCTNLNIVKITELHKLMNCMVCEL